MWREIFTSDVVVLIGISPIEATSSLQIMSSSKLWNTEWEEEELQWLRTFYGDDCIYLASRVYFAKKKQEGREAVPYNFHWNKCSPYGKIPQCSSSEARILSIFSFSCCQSRAVEKLGEMTKLEEKIHLHWISTSFLEVKKFVEPWLRGAGGEVDSYAGIQRGKECLPLPESPLWGFQIWSWFFLFENFSSKLYVGGHRGACAGHSAEE